MKYHCQGFKPIPFEKVETVKQAAKIFATRLARKEYGSGGGVGALNLNSWSQDNNEFDFSAFCGKVDSKQRTCDGKNYYFHISVY
jgi:hypothetical protein